MKTGFGTQFGPSGFSLDNEPALPALVAEWARHDPDRVFLEPVAAAPATYGQVHANALRWAAAHSERQVTFESPVLSMLRPGTTAVEHWLGTAWARGLDVAANTELRGATLAYVLSDSRAQVAVIEPEYLDRFAQLESLGSLELLVVAGDLHEVPQLNCQVQTVDEYLAAAPTHIFEDEPGPADISCVIYTSGTTGSPKGVLVPWGHLAAMLPQQWRSGAEAEAQYAPFPFYHVAGRVVPCLMARLGGRAVLRDAFSLSSFWDDVRKHRCTMVLLAGAVPRMLLQAHRPGTAANPLRKVIMAPVIEEHEQFAETFDVEIVTGYNMTEISQPFYEPDGIKNWRSCGRLRDGHPYYEARLVDDQDREVPAGETGELMVRTGAPWTLNAGYYRNPEASFRAWRNGWFHTGDAFRCDSEGNYYYVDRMTDSIRRRGENVSSADVESAVLEIEGVLECAAIGVPSPLGEHDIKIVVRLGPDIGLGPQTLHTQLQQTLPRFSLPRYVEMVHDFPRTEATHRVRKNKLREHWKSARTWDAETGTWLENPDPPA